MCGQLLARCTLVAILRKGKRSLAIPPATLT
jgi:hypothetical protein